MPDYLKIASGFKDLSPEDLASQLEQQQAKLQIAIERLDEADKVDPKLFDCVVSV